MVEFAMILPLLALLLVMAIDFGRVFFGWVALHNTARIGADFAAQNANAWPSNPDAKAVQARVDYELIMRNDLEAVNCSYTEPLPAPTFEDTDDPTNGDSQDWGDRATVRLTCDFTLITPLAENVLGGPIELTAASSFAIYQTVLAGVPEASPPITPTPSPSPSPAPTSCTAPNYVGQRANDAENLWDASDFTGTFTRAGSGNFTIASQTLVAGTTVPCNSSITVSNNASMTPAPTPSPTPVPTPPPTGTPTPTQSPTPTPVPCEPPVAAFTWNPQAPKHNENVQFTDTSAVAPNCTVTAWSWNFGDNTTSAAQSPTKKYNIGNSNTAQFTVTLTVTNVAGSSSASNTITVTK